MNLETVNTNVSRVPFFRFLNLVIQDIDSLQASTEITFDDRLIGNPIMEFYHGGIIASVMEATAAVAVLPDFADLPVKPINLTVDFLRPAVRGPLRALADVTQKGKRIASVGVIAWQEERDRPVAKGLYHFLLV